MSHKPGLPTLLVIGDSISVQYFPYLSQALEQTFSVHHKGDMKAALEDLDHPRGANCGDSSLVLALLQNLKNHMDTVPDQLLLNCGLHDIKTDPESKSKQVPLDEYRQNLEGIAATLKEQGIPTVWVRTTPVDDDRHRQHCAAFLRHNRDVFAYNKVADKIMEEAGIPCLDLYQFTLEVGGEIYCDHVHFTDPVRRQQAAFIAGYLTALRQTTDSSNLEQGGPPPSGTDDR